MAKGWSRAWLDETPIPVPENRQTGEYVYWHLERARIGSTRTVALEVIVDGQVAGQRVIRADGEIRPVTVDVDVTRSCWVALRILPSVHTAPIVICVANQSVRASRRSAEWCLACVDVLWNEHGRRIRESERPAAAAAWDHARNTYRTIANESAFD